MMSDARPASRASGDAAPGTIVAAFGRHYEVRLADGSLRTGYPRGKRSSYACGDEVTLSADGQLSEPAPRRSLLWRSDAFREKLLAANVTQLVLVVATQPSFSNELISRALVAAEDQHLRRLLVLNKADLADQLPAARAALRVFAELGYPVLELCATRDVAPLRAALTGQTSVLVGQSGMGKSTLTNAVIPEAVAATREISSALDSGKHTTTATRLYALPEGGALIDSPGLQEFGLAHLDIAAIEHGFVEFRPLLGQCRYRDCRHDREPDCALKAAVAEGRIDARRFAHYASLRNAHAAPPRY